MFRWRKSRESVFTFQPVWMKWMICVLIRSWQVRTGTWWCTMESEHMAVSARLASLSASTLLSSSSVATVSFPSHWFSQQTCTGLHDAATGSASRLVLVCIEFEFGLLFESHCHKEVSVPWKESASGSLWPEYFQTNGLWDSALLPYTVLLPSGMLCETLGIFSTSVESQGCREHLNCYITGLASC